MFQGHAMVKIGEEWVFNLTEFVGYKIKVSENNQIESYAKAFKIKFNGDKYSVAKYSGVPSGVIRKAYEIANKRREEALL